MVDGKLLTENREGWLFPYRNGYGLEYAEE